MNVVHLIGIQETHVERGQHRISPVHDLNARRLLFATTGRDHSTAVDFTADLQSYDSNVAQIEHVCMNMSATFAKGMREALRRNNLKALRK